MTSFVGKSVLVTGAASGIGQATADVFAEAGAKVYRADIAPGVEIALDVTKESDWKRVVAGMPRLDVFIHSAGISTSTPIEICTIEEWRRTIDVNLTGAFLGLKHVLPKLKANADGGSVVLIGSASGTKAAAGASAYCSSKAGLGMLARCAALETKDSKVRVNCISPAAVVTPMWKVLPEVPDRAKNPLERMAFPDEIAEAILFLAGQGSGGMTGADLMFDAGYTI